MHINCFHTAAYVFLNFLLHFYEVVRKSNIRYVLIFLFFNTYFEIKCTFLDQSTHDIKEWWMEISVAVRCCTLLVLTCFRLTKSRVTFLRPETIFASFLHLMVLFVKVTLTHISVVHSRNQPFWKDILFLTLTVSLM